MELLIPLFGISVGVIVPLAVFYWLYHENKNKNETIIEISKNLDDPSKLEDMLGMFWCIQKPMTGTTSIDNQIVQFILSIAFQFLMLNTPTKNSSVEVTEAILGFVKESNITSI